MLRPKRPEAPPPGKPEKKKKQKKESPPKYTGPKILQGVRAFYLPDDGKFTPKTHPFSCTYFCSFGAMWFASDTDLNSEDTQREQMLTLDFQ
jgi:hypothetical protein